MMSGGDCWREGALASYNEEATIGTTVVTCIERLKRRQERFLVLAGSWSDEIHRWCNNS